MNDELDILACMWANVLPVQVERAMTEQEWLVSSDPAAMLRHLRQEYVGYAHDTGGEWMDRETPLVSERQLRCWVEAVGCDHCATLCKGRGVYFWADSVSKCDSCKPAAEKVAALRDIRGNPFRPVMLAEKYTQRGLEVFTKVSRGEATWFNPAWLTPTVVALATAAHESLAKCGRCGGEGLLPIPGLSCTRCPDCGGSGTAATLDPDRLGILADALEDSGATDEQLLDHLRDTTTIHVRGCWVLSLILGQE